MRIICPHCKSTVNVADSLAGARIRCGACQQAVTLPTGAKTPTAVRPLPPASPDAPGTASRLPGATAASSPPTPAQPPPLPQTTRQHSGVGDPSGTARTVSGAASQSPSRAAGTAPSLSAAAPPSPPAMSGPGTTQNVVSCIASPAALPAGQRALAVPVGPPTSPAVGSDEPIRCPYCGSLQFFVEQRISAAGWTLIWIGILASVCTFTLSLILVVLGRLQRKYVNVCARCRRAFVGVGY
jgi:DNA-directed RNA polymerase subunit RPC12/RpoP